MEGFPKFKIEAPKVMEAVNSNEIREAVEMNLEELEGHLRDMKRQLDNGAFTSVEQSERADSLKTELMRRLSADTTLRAQIKERTAHAAHGSFESWENRAVEELEDTEKRALQTAA